MNKSLRRVRVPWIFFDLDDTLWNFSQNSTASLHALYDISPILRKLFKDKQEFIDTYHTHNERMWELYSMGKVTTAQLKEERWRRTLSTKQFEVLTAVCEELERTYLDILARQKIEMDYAHTLLNELQKKCIIAVISNGFSDTQYKKIRYSGLGRFITRTLVSEEININKPDKAFFEYAVNETGAVGPHLYIGDHPSTDILGAMKAGWYAIWINHKQRNFPLSVAEMREQKINPELFLGEFPNLRETHRAIDNFIHQIWPHRQCSATCQ